ncbi:hypothetical protein [Corallococcus macrosporus]|uniref:Uncharacterized protein n=1 Tax=Myxococcus fulvus (strain ATCC BAA-855 / HW-1) TaxID=483219 RepID=F8CB17_MYXFH|nr:hypothetical protein [Corallococcus macrosporus]AEI68398.1 hypothetical protein LILAB_32585 [Corallococcus macrosporus]
MPVERDRHGRFQVGLFGLPRWARLLIALAMTGLVVAAARFVEPHPVTPPWLADALHLGGWLYLALVLFAVTGWLVRRWKRSRGA